MTLPLRVIDTGLNAARWNVAMTAAVTELRRDRRIPDTLRFHRYPKSVLIGRHQVLADAVNIERCRTAKVEIARRLTGGGAVYMSPGALAWDIVAERKALGAGLDRCAAAMCEAVASGLSRLGLPARYRPQNDIEVGGRKICGSSGYFDGEMIVYQGTILIDTDLGDMARFLRFPPSSQGSHHLSGRLATVSELLGRRPDPGEIEDALAAAVAHVFGRAPRPDAATPDELRRASQYFDDEFGTEAFVNGVDMARGSNPHSLQRAG